VRAKAAWRVSAQGTSGRVGVVSALLSVVLRPCLVRVVRTTLIIVLLHGVAVAARSATLRRPMKSSRSKAATCALVAQAWPTRSHVVLVLLAAIIRAFELVPPRRRPQQPRASPDQQGCCWSSASVCLGAHAHGLVTRFCRVISGTRRAFDVRSSMVHSRHGRECTIQSAGAGRWLVRERPMQNLVRNFADVYQRTRDALSL